jgi:predicted dinucleotide-binding enzyme
VLSALIAACAVDPSPPGPVSTRRSAIVGAVVNTDHATYVAGATITATFSGMPGLAGDRILMFQAVPSPPQVWSVSTGGQTSGTVTFTAPGGTSAIGSYLVRALSGNVGVAESAKFFVGYTAVSTNQANYAPGATVTVSYTGFPGNAQDWITIVPAGASSMAYGDDVLTNGATSGTATFTAPATYGAYVVRSFSNATWMPLAESPRFWVSNSTISVDQPSYAPGATITVTYSGLPGNANDWIAIAASGSSNTSYVAYVVTNGQTSGTATFTAPAAGSYVARAFGDATYGLLAQTPPFAVGGLAISTDQASYLSGATVTVTYAGLPGNAKDWIAIAPAGSANTSYVAFVFTNGQTSGTATFASPGPGSYVARAFANNTYALLLQSATFAVTGSAVSTDHASYPVGATVTVTYTGLPGNPKDWIAVAPAGSANTSYVAFVYTNGQSTGTATFTAPAPGAYVARAFANDTYTQLAESPTFTVNNLAVSTDRSSYAPGAPVVVTYTGLPGNPKDWIAIAHAGSPNTSYLAFQYTNGQASGTATFTTSLDAGAYVVRVFANNTYTQLAETPFRVAWIVTNANRAQSGSTIGVGYAGLPGNANDYIAIAPAGSGPTTTVALQYTNGQTSGNTTFGVTATGSYVARAFAASGELLAESAPFAVASISRDQAYYALGSPITVAYAGLPGNSDDAVALAPYPSLPDTTPTAVIFTNGQTSGTATFASPGSGAYVARAISYNSRLVFAESPAFNVATIVYTDAATYTQGSLILVGYQGLPGNPKDWIAISPAGSSVTSYADFRFSSGQTSGGASFVAPAAGSWVARVYANNTYQLLAESAVFTTAGP